MAITTVSTPVGVYDNTDAGFRKWGKAIADTMTALDCTEVFSDIDFATVALPGVNQTYAGKRVYSIDDALHTTSPIYIAVHFGKGTSSAGIGFQFRVVVGQSHSSGVVSGNTMDHYIVTNNASSDIGEFIGVRTDAGISIFSNIPMATYKYSHGFMVERVCLAGEPTEDGVVGFYFGTGIDAAANSGAVRFQSFNYAINYSYGTGSGFAAPIAFSEASDGSFDDKAPVFPIYTFGQYDCLSGVIGVGKSYLPAQRFTAVVNGVSGTYRTLPESGPQLSSSYQLVAMRVG